MDSQAIKSFLVDYQHYVLSGLFLFCLLIQLFYYLGLYSRLIFYKDKPASAVTEPVSVIICARNEAENLEKYLPAVLSQQYPVFEVIVVDDGSSDTTEEVVRRLMAGHPHLRMTAIREDRKFSHGKKLAVTIGIKAARHDILLFTDADCVPAGDQWLKKMVSHFTGGKAVVIGYGGYFSRKGLLNKFIRYETLVIAMQYLSYALGGIPYMGVGRNLAYRKSFFYQTAGFTRHLHLLSGDDDLFINENATRKNVAVEYSHESHTRSDPASSFRQWTRQKKRHLTTAPLYKGRDKFVLTLEPFSRLFFYLLFALLMFYPGLRIYALGAFAFRMLVQLLVIKYTMIRLKENKLLLYSLLFDVFALFVNFVLFVSNRISVRNRPWK